MATKLCGPFSGAGRNEGNAMKHPRPNFTRKPAITWRMRSQLRTMREELERKREEGRTTGAMSGKVDDGGEAK